MLKKDRKEKVHGQQIFRQHSPLVQSLVCLQKIKTRLVIYFFEHTNKNYCCGVLVRWRRSPLFCFIGVLSVRLYWHIKKGFVGHTLTALCFMRPNFPTTAKYKNRNEIETTHFDWQTKILGFFLQCESLNVVVQCISTGRKKPAEKREAEREENQYSIWAAKQEYFFCSLPARISYGKKPV